MLIKRFLISVFMTLMLCLTTIVEAQDSLYVFSRSRCVIHSLYFHHDDDVVDMDYMGNQQMFDNFRHTIDSVGLRHVDSIRVVVQSSPEGPVAHNIDLSRRRAINTERYFAQNFPEIMPITEVRPDGESWGQLRRFILEDTLLTDADVHKLVDIIDKVSDPTIRKERLRATGKLYDYLYATYYPRLRNTIIASVYTTEITAAPYGVYPDGYWTNKGLQRVVGTPERPDTLYLRDTIVVKQTSVILDTLYAGGVVALPYPYPAWPYGPEWTAKDSIRHHVVMALKTNLFFDVVGALNGEIEFPIGKRHSLMAEVVWPWWLQKSHNRWCYEMGAGSLEYRYWFRSWEQHKSNVEWYESKRQPLRGHFLGLYGGAGYYDYQWKRHNGYQGEFWTGGLTYGYSRYLSPHTRLEFSVGGGFVKNKYRTYHIDDNTSVEPHRDQHLWRDGRKRNNWIGPTKAKISISVLLFKKCRPKRSDLAEPEDSKVQDVSTEEEVSASNESIESIEEDLLIEEVPVEEEETSSEQEGEEEL